MTVSTQFCLTSVLYFSRSPPQVSRSTHLFISLGPPILWFYHLDDGHPPFVPFLLSLPSSRSWSNVVMVPCYPPLTLLFSVRKTLMLINIALHLLHIYSQLNPVRKTCNHVVLLCFKSRANSLQWVLSAAFQFCSRPRITPFLLS